MRFLWIVIFVSFVGNAYAGDYCKDAQNASTEFCESVRKSEEALQKVRELIKKADEIRTLIDHHLDKKLKDVNRK